MAEVNRQDIDSRLTHTGVSGDLNRAWFPIPINAAAVADVVFIGKIPAGSIVSGLRIDFDALGGGTTLDVGYQNDDATATDFFFSAEATASVGQAEVKTRPIMFEKDTYLIATVGGGEITGVVDVTLDYVYRGTL